MADDGSEPGPSSSSSSISMGKRRLPRSAVHDHFDQVQVEHPISKKTVNGSQCKECRATFTNRVSTNLKAHLQAKHPEAFEKVLRK